MNNSEVKICQNCKQQFEIDAQDFAFYEKIGVPPPTFCPECRLQRRMAQLNIRSLFKRSCDLCHAQGISLFPADSPYTVYCQKCWWSDAWDATSYGAEVDFSRPFLAQYHELLERIPQFGPQTMHMTMINSDYCNIASYLKNCYLVFNSDFCEDSAYSTYLEHGKNSADIYMGDLCELCYESSNIYKCNRVIFSVNCNDCFNVSFSRNCVGCSDCFGCVNLRGKQYHIFNQPYTREAYLEELKKYDTTSRKAVLEIKQKVHELATRLPRKFAEGLKNLYVSGDYIFNSKNTHLSYEVGSGEDCKYCQFLFLPPSKDSHDITMWGGNFTRSYECMGIGNGQTDMKFCVDCWSEENSVEYSRDILAPGSYLFGCVALRNKKYCILNREYSKEEYEALVAKIKEHMVSMPFVDSRGRTYAYGEFPPVEFSHFAYNESLAQEYFPLTREAAEVAGYRWREREMRNYAITKKAEQLPDALAAVDDSIVNETIECAHRGECEEQCSSAFRIIPSELQLYRALKVPLPRLCPNCRNYARLKERNQVTTKFFKRTCMCAGQGALGLYQNTAQHTHGTGPCGAEFETLYAPDRAEIVYCESCYNSEVA